MKDRKQAGCILTKDNLIPCQALQKAIEPIGNRKGITLSQFFNIKTMEPASVYAVLKIGEFSKKGIVMNYCCFCGNRIVNKK